VQLPIKHIEIKQAPPEVTLDGLIEAMHKVIAQQTLVTHHQIHRESLSVRERMALILQRLQNEKLIEFSTLLQHEEGRQGVVVSLLALLELAKQTLLVITQTTAFAPIYIKACNE
jgi:segregation and condensation protein A